MHNVLYTDHDKIPFPDELLPYAQRREMHVVKLDGHDHADIVKHGSSCEGLFVLYAEVTDELLRQLPSLRVVGRVGTGYDRIDVDAALNRGVLVTYVPDAFTEELASQVLMFVLAFSRQLPFLVEQQRLNRWVEPLELPSMSRLSEERLGVIGFGPSGQEVAAKARRLGMQVCVWSRTARPAIAAELDVVELPLEEVLGSDYVSLHLALTPDTERFIDRERLRLFSNRGVLINIARGGLVDTDALTDALSKGALRGAGLDVFDPEPLPSAHPLWQMQNVLLTAHSGGNSDVGVRSCISNSVDDVARYLTGGRARNPVPEHLSIAHLDRYGQKL